MYCLNITKNAKSKWQKSWPVLLIMASNRKKSCFKVTVSYKYFLKAYTRLQTLAYSRALSLCSVGTQMHLCNKPKDGVRESSITL